jgi:hypothetical protein
MTTPACHIKQHRKINSVKSNPCRLRQLRLIKKQCNQPKVFLKWRPEIRLIHMTSPSNQLLNPLQGNNRYLWSESDETINRFCGQKARLFTSKRVVHVVNQHTSNGWCFKSCILVLANKCVTKFYFISSSFALSSWTTPVAYTDT